MLPTFIEPEHPEKFTKYIIMIKLLEITGKIDKLEARLMNDEINAETYKKWRESFSCEKAILESDIEKSANGTDKLSEKWSKLNSFLQGFKSIKDLYKIATFDLKRALIQRVFNQFNQFLTFSEGVFRTPSLNVSLSHNLLKIK